MHNSHYKNYDLVLTRKQQDLLLRKNKSHAVFTYGESNFFYYNNNSTETITSVIQILHKKKQITSSLYFSFPQHHDRNDRTRASRNDTKMQNCQLDDPDNRKEKSTKNKR